jgi:hypothetical protein
MVMMSGTIGVVTLVVVLGLVNGLALPTIVPE